jgi:Kdo2-lipid IVA lauroyltransferase/acyltransferase
MAKFMKPIRMLRQPFESILTVLGFCFIPLLPRFVVVRLAKFLGLMAWMSGGRDRSVARANLALAFGSTKTSAELDRIGRASFQSFAMQLLDLFWFGMFTRSRFERWVKFDASFKAAFETKPLLFVTAHMGGWELMGQAFALKGESLMSLAADQSNVMVNRILNIMRERTGQIIVEKMGALKHMMKALKQGGRVAMVGDQNVLPQEGGEFLPYFGLPVPVPRAPGALCRHSGAPVLFAYCIPDRSGLYTAKALPPADLSILNESEASLSMTKMLEDVVRENPEYWLWSYKRWKYIPEGADAGKYPFYSRRL